MKNCTKGNKDFNPRTTRLAEELKSQRNQEQLPTKPDLKGLCLNAPQDVTFQNGKCGLNMNAKFNFEKTHSFLVLTNDFSSKRTQTKLIIFVHTNNTLVLH